MPYSLGLLGHQLRRIVVSLLGLGLERTVELGGGLPEAVGAIRRIKRDQQQREDVRTKC